MYPWNTDELTFDESTFTGTVRLFLLPELVMFPHVMQPLNISKQPYLDLLNDALDGDGMLALSVLPSGGKSDQAESPTILPYACLCKVVTHQQLSDGSYNVLLLGVHRLKIVEEAVGPRGFRTARVELMRDLIDTENSVDSAGLQTALTSCFEDNLPGDHPASFAVRDVLSTEVPLGMLTDLMSFALPLPLELKSNLFAESDIVARAWMLLDALQSPQSQPPTDTPPSEDYLHPFSLN